jgi:hypothetical protein
MFVDAKVAAVLYKGSVVRYVVEPESGTSNGWIHEHITPKRDQARNPH